MCEEFGCLPSEARRELRRSPDLVFDILKLRGFARAFHEFQTAKAEDSLKPAGADPMLDLVWEFTAERLQQRDDDE